MKLTNLKLTGLWAGIVLTVCSFGAYAAESPKKTHINQNQINGRIVEAKGKVKAVTGKMLDDKVIKLMEPPRNLVIQGSH